MKTLVQRLKISLQIFTLGFGLLLAQNLAAAPAAPTFTVSPATVSNTYSGTITLQIGGLTNGETVVVQKYLNLNGQGVITTNDWLVQQFNLTDGQAGMVIGGVTNFNVPGDSDATAGQITAKLNFQNGDFIQNVVGKYLFKLTSPVGHFTPVTNPLVVTSFPYPQKFTGTVVSNGTGAVVPNAVILLSSAGGNGGPTAGVVANSAGSYTIPAPVGIYAPIAVSSGSVFNGNGSGLALTLAAGQTVTANLTVTNATASITGKLVDANNSSLGLPGTLMAAHSTNGLMGVGFTDPNGNFTIGVLSSTVQWSVSPNATGSLVDGYLSLQNGSSVNAGTTGVILAVPKGTALFYGSVQDNLGNPVPGVQIEAQDNNNLYKERTYTDAKGNYVAVALGGLNNDAWQVQLNSSSGNYLFSQPSFDQNGGTNISAGQATQVNFTATWAAYTISGYLKDASGNPLANINVYAYTTTGANYNQNANTDATGYYSIYVPNGTWQVGVNSCSDCGGNSLPGNYLDPQNQTVVIANTNATVNFTAVLAPYTISGSLKDGNGNPLASIGVYAYTTTGANYNQNTSTDANGNYSMGVVNGTWQVGVNSGGGDNILPGNYLAPPNQTVVIANANGAANFTAILAPYTISGSLKDGSGNPIAGIGVYADAMNYNQGANTDANGNFSLNVINGTWSVGVSCSFGPGGHLDDLLGSGNYQCPGTVNLTLANNNGTANFIVLPSGVSLGITTKTLPDDLVGNSYNQQLNASGGQPPYNWSLTAGSLALPAGISISTNGIISGTPITPDLGTNYFSVRVTDQSGNTADQLLSLAIYPVLTMAANPLPNGTVGAPYSAQIMVSGGSPNYGGYSLFGSFAPGLILSFGTITSSNQLFIISGTPTNSGIFSFTFIAHNDGLFDVQHDFSITIVSSSLQITTPASLTGATAAIPYTNQLQASGGTEPYTWTIATGSQQPPLALTLSTGGLLSGVPAASGTSTFIVRVTDINLLTVTRSFTLITLGPAAPLQITTTSLPIGTNGVLYSQTLQASGGVAPYTWSLASGSANPPANVSLTQAGLLSGIPTSTGAFGFTVMVTDHLGATSTQALSLTTTASPLQITTTSLPSARQNIFYTNALFAAGGQPPYTWSLAPESASLPQGLAVGTNGGISGTVTNSGTNNFTVLVTDALGATNSQLLTLVVIAQVGSLQITIAPQGATNAGRWQVDSGAPQMSGAIVSGLSAGSHTVSFNTISNWVTPSNQIVVITGGQMTTATGTYGQVQYGALKAIIIPATIGAKWQVDGGKVESSGAIVTNLAAGNHIVSFTAISGYLTPTNETVVVTGHSTNTASGTYVATGSLQVTLNPATAIAPWARWRVDFGGWQISGATVTNLPVGNHPVDFSGIDDWGTPVNQTVAIKLKTVTKATGTYTFNGAGIYNGLFMQPEVTVGRAGMLQNLTVTTSGAYTGKLLLGATTTSISGSFNNAGQATNSLKLPKLGLVTLTMQVSWNNLGPVSVGGTASGTNGGAWQANLIAELAASGLPSADYTELMGVPAGAAGTPSGYGYMLLTNHAGAVVLSGSLADGTAFSQSVPVSGVLFSSQPSLAHDRQQLGDVFISGNLPIYASLYGNTGLLIGWLNLENGAPAGSLAWIKEASRFSVFYTNGFTNPVVALQGSLWTNPLPKTAAIDLPAGVLTITNGNLVSNLTFNVAVTNNNTLVKLAGGATNSLTGTISTVSSTRGLLTVTFGNGAGKAATTGKGAVLQNMNSAGGYFLGKTNAGAILLQP